jgi:hypothetical protein
MAMTLLDLSEAKAQVSLDKQAATEAAARDKEALVKQAQTPFLYGLTADDSEDAKFRRITAPNTLRDLNPLMHERMQAVCFFLAATTPFGKRIVEIISSYVVGEGFKASAADAEVQDVISRFWDDEINSIESNLEKWCEEETKFGELCIPVAVNDVDGFVRLGYVDPQRIEAVEYGKMQTVSGSEDILFPVAVRLRRTTTEPEGRKLAIIRMDEDVNSSTYGQLVGDCFYFSINQPKGGSRGVSELFSLADWIDVFDQMIFDFADKVRYLNSFVWHYTLEGADDKRITEFLKKVTQNPPRQGGVQATNSTVKMEAVTPDLKGADMAASANLVKLYGLGGAGLPAWFFADPVDANRSTADEMTGPTGKKLTSRQNDLKRNLRKILRFVIQQAIYHGVLSQTVDQTISIEAPDLLIKDLQKAALTLGAVTGALQLGVESGWIQNETAARGFYIVLSQIGVDLDSKDEFEKAQKEKSDRDVQNQNNLLPQSNLADALNKLTQGGNENQGKTEAQVQ